MVRVALQAGVAYPGHFRAFFQPAGHLQGTLAVAPDAQVQGLQAQVQVEGVLRALGRAQVPHQVGGGLHDIGRLAEAFGIGEAVVGGIGRGEAGEAFGVGFPWEVPAVHHGAAHAHAMSVDVFGGGMGHYVRAPFEGTAQDRSGEGVVHYQRKPVAVSCSGPASDIKYFDTGIGEGFAKDQFGPGPDGRLDLFVGSIGLQESDADPQPGQRDAQQVEGAAVDVVGGDDVVSCTGDVQDREQVGRLPGGGEDGSHAALQVIDPGSHGVYGRVLQAGVEVSALFQVEQPAHLVRGLVFEGCALDDGNLPGLPFSGCISGVNTTGVNLCHSVRVFDKDRV